MPNWAMNKVEIEGEDQQKAMSLLVNDKGEVDFNILKPMPESLNITAGSRMLDAFGLALIQGDLTEEELKPFLLGINAEQAMERVRKKIAGLDSPYGILECDIEDDSGEEYYRKVVSNIRNYGCPTWYEWAYREWGTKWNACHQQEVTDTGCSLILEFDTAWSEPTGVIAALEAKVQELGLDVTIHWDVAYEEGGTAYHRIEPMKAAA